MLDAFGQISLELEYDITMTDARGHSGSKAPGKRCGKQDHATDLAELIESLTLEKPGLIGHSMEHQTS